MAPSTTPLTPAPAGENVKPRNLLTLPGEIRNAIYRAGVVTTEPVKVRVLYKGRTDTHHLWQIDAYEPPLATVLKATRKEVLSIFYAENTFELVRLSHLRSRDFLERLQAWRRYLKEYVHLLRHVHLNFSNGVFRVIEGRWKDLWENFKVRLDVTAHDTIDVNVYAVERDESFCACDLRAAAAQCPSLLKSDRTYGARLLILAAKAGTSSRKVVHLERCRRCHLQGREETLFFGRRQL